MEGGDEVVQQPERVSIEAPSATIKKGKSVRTMDSGKTQLSTTTAGGMTMEAESMPSPKKAAEMKRLQVRNYIRNERDTTLRRWMALNEAMHSEDLRREQFMEKRLRDDARILPIPVEKLVANLKRAVHKTMREKGGTPFSILRQMFLYWDGLKVGSLTLNDFTCCMKSLGIEISEADRREIFSYYSKKNDGTMGYIDLLSDIQKNEPTILECLCEEKDDNYEMRFAEAEDFVKPKTKKLLDFIDATRFQIGEKMRNEGGTMYYHARKIFQRFDYDYSGGLSPEELCIAARHDLGLNMTQEDANDIVAYYDRRKTGEMKHALFIADVCEGLTSILSFAMTTKEAVLENRRKIAQNPFICTPFRAHSNKLLERIKEAVRKSLETRVMKTGGSYKSWVHEAFMFWDPRNTGIIREWSHLQGALKRLGAQISQEEAETMMTCYDKKHEGSFAYRHVMDDLLQDEPNVIKDTTVDVTAKVPFQATARAPPIVDKYIRKIKNAGEIFVRKSKGTLEARDIIHGTFLRFDAGQSGRIDSNSFTQASKDLGVTVKPADVDVIITWFDTSGGHLLDYNEFTRQLFGDDVLTKTFSLPSLSRQLAGTSTLAASTSSLSFSGSVTPKLPNTSNKPFSNLGGTTTSSGPDKTLIKETQLVKEARKQIRRNLMLQERSKLQSKLDSVERQRRKIIEDHKQKVADRKGA